MRRFPLLLAMALLVTAFSPAQDTKSKLTPDVLVFTNGDQLTGKLERATSGSIVFKSDMAGELTVSFDKIKELRSGSAASQFAVLRKGVPVKYANSAPEGTIDYAEGTLTVAPADAPSVSVKPADLSYLIDRRTFDRSVAHRAGPLEGWNGTITGGATLVRSTQTSTTFTASASVVRVIPTVPYLPARNRTAINVTETYGKQTAPVIPPANPPTLPSVVVSNVFHADAERDEYFSPRLYVLADTSQDHNYSLGLQLQQVYGAGVGWTPLKTPRQELDLKGEVHYEKQAYFSTTVGVAPSPDVHLFGSTFAENYVLHLPRKLVFTETGNVLPAWTELHDYAANLTATIAVPVFKRLSASFTTTDNYLNDPQPFYKHNSYQFVTGVTYTLQ